MDFPIRHQPFSTLNNPHPPRRPSAMPSKDYYQLLGVDKNASAEDLKKAFRTLAHKHHPDKPGGDAEKFKEINAAYQVLGDPEKRKQYDQFGSAAFDGSGGGGNPFGGAGGFDFSGFQGFQGGGFEDLGDLFGGMFGGGRQREPRGNDIAVDVDLSFHDAVFGVEKTVTVTKPSTCERCGGVGAEPGSKMKTCTECNGKGVKTVSQRTILGTIQTRVSCPTCDGEGEVPEKPCTECKGSGIARRKSTITVTIPAGAEDGAGYRLRGEGEAVRGGQPGDLIVRVHVEPDTRFERDGSSIRSVATIGFTQAALGDQIDVETVDGKVELKIPPGTQSGTEFRLRNKGIPTRSNRGDHLVTVEVLTPTKLSKEQKELLEKLNLKGK